MRSKEKLQIPMYKSSLENQRFSGTQSSEFQRNSRGQTNYNNQMTKNQNKPYDLEKRTLKYSKGIIRLCRKLPKDVVNIRLIGQLIDASGSVGANYCEADDASTKKEFFYKIGTCRKESKESKYWLQMVITAVSSLKNEARILLTEAQELNLIFSAIINRRKK